MKKTIIVLFVLFQSLNLFAPVAEFKLQELDKLDNWLEYIKEHEGLRLTPYLCPAGAKTIGYGHVIKKSEHFIYITKKQADSLLFCDFMTGEKYIKDLQGLSKEQRYAILHFIFANGCGNWLKSTARQEIKKGLYPVSLLNWVYYTDTYGNKVKSEIKLKNRKKELEYFANWK